MAKSPAHDPCFARFGRFSRVENATAFFGRRRTIQKIGVIAGLLSFFVWPRVPSDRVLRK
jgi:hypothetical protein